MEDREKKVRKNNNRWMMKVLVIISIIVALWVGSSIYFVGGVDMWFWCGMPDPYIAWFTWSDREYPGHDATCIECERIDQSLDELMESDITSITEGKMKFGDISFAIGDTRDEVTQAFRYFDELSEKDECNTHCYLCNMNYYRIHFIYEENILIQVDIESAVEG